MLAQKQRCRTCGTGGWANPSPDRAIPGIGRGRQGELQDPANHWEPTQNAFLWWFTLFAMAGREGRRGVTLVGGGEGGVLKVLKITIFLELHVSALS